MRQHNAPDLALQPLFDDPASPEELDVFAPDQVGALARYEELGVTRCIVGFNPDKRNAILPVLDLWAGFMHSAGNLRNL